MKVSKKTCALTPNAVYLRRRIASNRSRAVLVGVLYLFATLALAAAACFPLLVQDLAPVGLYGKWAFWKVFKPANLKILVSTTKTAADIIRFANGVIYALVFVGIAINVLRALTKITWLLKTRASKIYGFNRNVYAMEDLGKIFSGSFTIMLAGYFIIAILCGQAIFNWLAVIVLGAGVVLHLLAGYLGSKTVYIDVEDREIIIKNRLVGRISPLIRNFVQVIAVCAMVCLFVKVCVLGTLIAPLMETNGFKNYLAPRPLTYIVTALEVLAMVCLIVLMKHSFATTEYNFHGANGKGMQTAKVASLMGLIFTAAAFVCKFIFGEISFEANAAGGWTTVITKGFDWLLLLLVGIWVVLFVVEILMRKLPKLPAGVEQVEEEEELQEEETFEFQAPVQEEEYEENEGYEDYEEEAPQEEKRGHFINVTCPHCGANNFVYTGDVDSFCWNCNEEFNIQDAIIQERISVVR